MSSARTSRPSRSARTNDRAEVDLLCLRRKPVDVRIVGFFVVGVREDDMLVTSHVSPGVFKAAATLHRDVALEMSMQEMMNIARSAGVAVPGMMPGGPAPGGDARPADTASDPTSGGSIMTSLQAMGLRLESRKTAFDTMIVDKLEKAPTEN